MGGRIVAEVIIGLLQDDTPSSPSQALDQVPHLPTRDPSRQEQRRAMVDLLTPADPQAGVAALYPSCPTASVRWCAVDILLEALRHDSASVSR